MEAVEPAPGLGRHADAKECAMAVELAGPTTATVCARGLVKQFRRSGAPPIRAVDGVDLDVPAGQILAFLGPNGAGKTTTLDMLLGLSPPDAGTVTVAGLPPRAAVRAGKVSAVLQSGGLLNDLTVGETVRLIASTFDTARPAGEVIERAGLTALASRRVSKCSGGEQQRLRFALALLPDPDLLILDEPTAGMDVTARQEFWDTMRADARSGRTVIFATHYLEEADAFAERIVVIARGRIVADGTASDIRARSAGRVLSVDIPEGHGAEWVERAATKHGLTLIETRGGRAFFHARDTDAAALTLLSELGARNLEIAAPTLDSAFVALTAAAPGEQVT
jgi:ABC-2 type transport system ATP-binding protein